jgi:hypothetical protein
MTKFADRVWSDGVFHSLFAGAGSKDGTRPSARGAERPGAASSGSGEAINGQQQLFRGVVEAHDWRGSPCHAFVMASDHDAALRKIAAAVAAIEERSPDSVAERVFSVASLPELASYGQGDVDLRLFETGWSEGRPTYCTQPMFLLSAPAALMRQWASCPQDVPQEQE